MNFLKNSLVEARVKAARAGAGIRAQEIVGVRVEAEVPLLLLEAPASSFLLVGRRLRQGLCQVSGLTILLAGGVVLKVSFYFF